ncbi:TlpA disulfide reductase family protein [Nonlabens ponticola]|uniref:AhpC/TSA family protein n=1 Tax=Nonlabens ponticola TaxID=2496866 RepID=A0A3S9MYN1_9FLAO|nr:TlpA disulfide reductase family protein [Nonlabens ponticola]AZQ44259.1 AhpC/TSA family protein [Nonlabens ponticola]
MRHIFLFIAVALLFNGCKDYKPAEPRITGIAPDVLNGMRIYLFEVNELNGQLKRIDTAIVMNNEFDFGELDKVDYNRKRFLSLDGSSGFAIFLSENDAVQIALNKSNIEASTIQGGPINQRYESYSKAREKFKKVYLDLKQSARTARNDSARSIIALEKLENRTNVFTDSLISIIQESPDDPLNLVYLSEMAIGALITPKESREVYNMLSDRMKQHPDAKMLDRDLADLETVAIGSKAPYFEGRSPDGSIIKLPEVLGKVTLVDFWASWCGPCRKENLNIVSAYNKYHDSGFNIIGVSLDKPGEKEKWVAAIKQDSLAWNHISRLAHWSDPIAKKYQVKGIPASFLLDENGIIIGKDLRGQALHEKLSRLLD